MDELMKDIRICNGNVIKQSLYVRNGKGCYRRGVQYFTGKGDYAGFETEERKRNQED